MNNIFITTCCTENIYKMFTDGMITIKNPNVFYTKGFAFDSNKHKDYYIDDLFEISEQPIEYILSSLEIPMGEPIITIGNLDGVRELYFNTIENNEE